MNANWSEEDLKQIARQLSHPDGDAGIITGERMKISNGKFMQKLPFTKFGFHLYDSESVGHVLSAAQFFTEHILEEPAQIPGKPGQKSSARLLVLPPEKCNIG
ncbi:hypothetical protein [Spirosoma areae]